MAEFPEKLDSKYSSMKTDKNKTEHINDNIEKKINSLEIKIMSLENTIMKLIRRLDNTKKSRTNQNSQTRKLRRKLNKGPYKPMARSDSPHR